jgi:hypothetical protein
MTNLELIEIGIGLLFILISYFYFSREVVLRRQTENLLRQQTDRERIVTRIAQHSPVFRFRQGFGNHGN